mgnify:CR=1 FL=1
MISFSIEPIESEPWNSDPSQTMCIGYYGNLTITFNDLNHTTVKFIVGGEDNPVRRCIESAQAILYGISSECKKFADELEKR